MTPIRLFFGVIEREEVSMTNNPMYDREALRRLFAEARVQRSRELRAAARQMLGAVRWNGVTLACVALVAVVSIAACAG
jgi:hypothetical protein